MLFVNGIVHPKMKNPVIIDSLSRRVQTCMNVFVLNTNEDILKKVVIRAVLDTMTSIVGE